jgi:hypothetical protein
VLAVQLGLEYSHNFEKVTVKRSTRALNGTSQEEATERKGNEPKLHEITDKQWDDMPPEEKERINASQDLSGAQD